MKNKKEFEDMDIKNGGVEKIAMIIFLIIVV
jgi:hypothetical protein